jgi:hypothetical protein
MGGWEEERRRVEGDFGMEQRQVDGIDAYNFPTDLYGHPLLAWMGDDYAQYVAAELLRRFRQQDAGTEMVAIKCEERPQLLTSVDERTGTVRGVVAMFNLQVLLLASSGQHWCLYGDGRFTAIGLDQPGQASITMGFEVRSTNVVT